MFNEKSILNKAKLLNKTIVFPEGNSERVIEAVKILSKKKIVDCVLIGDENLLKDKISDVTIVNPNTSGIKAQLTQALYEKRKDKGMTLLEAKKIIKNPFYFATMMVECGFVDGMVGGVEHSTADCLRPALQIIKGKNNIKTISSCVMFIGTKKLNIGENNVIFTADCALNINPDVEQLKDIVYATVDTATNLANINPKVALLSYSTKGSGDGDDVSKMQAVFKLLKGSKFIYDGEFQLDTAIVPSVAKKKAPKSKIQGDANILIFPNLTSGNICYKAIERFGKLKAIGQIIQGLKKPVNDMSRGCSVNDIVVISAITAIQSKE